MTAFSRLLVWLLAMTAVPAAAAQQAGASSGTSPERSLDLNIWMGAGHHERIVKGGQDVTTLDPTAGADNLNGQFGLGATFSRRRQRLQVSADGETAFRADSAARRLWALDHRGAVRVAFRLTNRTLVDV